jgi:hypothetical protein
MNRELNHHPRNDGSREDRENQPARDTLVSISHLPNVSGQSWRSEGSARGLSQRGIPPFHYSGLGQQLGNSIRIVAFHGADVITGLPGSDQTKRLQGQTAIAVSRK